MSMFHSPTLLVGCVKKTVHKDCFTARPKHNSSPGGEHLSQFTFRLTLPLASAFQCVVTAVFNARGLGPVTTMQTATVSDATIMNQPICFLRSP